MFFISFKDWNSCYACPACICIRLFDYASSIDKICSAYVINELQITPTALTGGGGRFMEQSRVHPPWPDRRTRPN